MRPKKVILLVDPCEHELSVTSFMLTTNGYRVLGATTPAEAVRLFKANQVDVVLADCSTKDLAGMRLVAQLKRRASHVPMVLVGDASVLSTKTHGAEAVFHKKTIPAWEILERVKILSARKRGPRKGQRRYAAA